MPINSKEIFPIVDNEGNTIGSASRLYCHNGSKVLHPVVHLHIFNRKGELYLQKRSIHKDIQPGKWDTAVGGHIDYGEKVIDALFREAREELGIIDFEPQLLNKYIFESTIERELIHSYYTIYEGRIIPDMDEVEEGHFWNLNEIKKLLDKEIFTPNFEYEFKTLILPQKSSFFVK